MQLAPHVIGYIRKAQNIYDCNNAKILADTVFMSMASGEIVDYSNVWYNDGSAKGSANWKEHYNHLYIYVDSDEIRCSSKSVAELLMRENIVTGKYTIRSGKEPVFSFSAKNTKFACGSSKPWDRYQINFYNRDGTIWYTFSAFSAEKVGKNAKKDTETSEYFASMAGGPPDTEQFIGGYS